MAIFSPTGNTNSPLNGLIDKARAVAMVTAFKDKTDGVDTHYVTFPANRLFCFMAKMIKDHNATAFRFYFARHDQALQMPNPRIPGGSSTDNYKDKDTLVVVAVRPAEYDSTILEEIIDNTLTIDLNCLGNYFPDNKSMRPLDFGTLNPPHAQHELRRQPTDPFLSIHEEVYGD